MLRSNEVRVFDLLIFEDAAFSGLLARCISQMLRGSAVDNLRFLWMDDIVPGSIQIASGGNTVTAKAFVSAGGGKSFVHYRLELQFGPVSTEMLQRHGRSAIDGVVDTISDLRADRQAREIQVRFG